MLRLQFLRKERERTDYSILLFLQLELIAQSDGKAAGHRLLFDDPPSHLFG